MQTTKVGETWRCKKTVMMNDNPANIAYVSGKEYKCEKDNYLTDEKGFKEHGIGTTEWRDKHFDRVLKHTDFAHGEVLKLIETSGKEFITRVGTSFYLSLQTSKLIERKLNFEWEKECVHPTPKELSWFEYCEKNQAFTSFEDFRSLGSKAKLPSPNYKKGDKVRMIRVPMHDEWKAIKEPVQDISDMLGKVYTVYHCQTGSWVSLVEHDNFYPIECFEPVLDATPTEVPHGTLVQADYIVPELKLYKKKTIVTFDTEVERVKDLSNIKLFKPSKNRYT